MSECSTCKKPLRTGNKSGYCTKHHYMGEGRKANRAAASRKYRVNNPEKYRNRQLRRVYGITLEQRDRMIVEQGGACAICRDWFEDTKKTHVDHCHSTGTVRGILCSNCNVGLGYFQDSPDLLIAASGYLQKSVDAKP